MPYSWKWRLVLALIGVVLWSHPGISAKIERFTDKEGNLHISNESQAEPGKPGGVQTPTPIGTPPPQIFPPATPPAPVPPPPVLPPPMKPPEMSGNEGGPPAEPPAPESGGGAQPAPAAPPAQVTPGQQE